MPEVINSKCRACIYFVVFGFIGAVIALLGASLPYLAGNVGVPLTGAGFLFSIRSLGYLLGSFFISQLYDRFPGTAVMAGTLVVVALAIFFIPFTSFVFLLGLLIFITGAGLGGTDVGGNSLVMWGYRDKSGPYLNGLFFFAAVGGILSPLLLGWFLKGNLDFGWTFWLLAIFIIPIALILLRKKPPSPVSVRQTEPVGRLDYRLVVLFGILFFIYVSLEVSYGGWIYSYMLITEPGEIQSASYITSAFWFAIAAGRLLSLPFSARVHPKTILLVSLTGALASLGFMLVTPNTYIYDLVGTVGIGLSIASLSPVTLSLAERSMPIYSKTTRWLWVFGSAGAIISPWLIGRMIDQFTPLAMIVALFIFVLAGLMDFLGLNIYILRSNSQQTRQ